MRGVKHPDDPSDRESLQTCATLKALPAITASSDAVLFLNLARP